MAHKLTMKFWYHGTLVSQDHKFENFDSALYFAERITKPSKLRIYNEYNELVHEIVHETFSDLVYA